MSFKWQGLKLRDVALDDGQRGYLAEVEGDDGLRWFFFRRHGLPVPGETVLACFVDEDGARYGAEFPLAKWRAKPRGLDLLWWAVGKFIAGAGWLLTGRRS